MFVVLCATNAYASAEKVSYKFCLDTLNIAKALDGDILTSAMARNSFAEVFGPLGEVTIFVAQYQEGPAVGNAQAAIVFAFEGDDHFTLQVECSPSKSIIDLGNGRQIIANRMEAVNTKQKAEVDEPSISPTA